DQPAAPRRHDHSPDAVRNLPLPRHRPPDRAHKRHRSPSLDQARTIDPPELPTPLLGDAPLPRLRTSGSKGAVEPVGDRDGSSKLELDERAGDLIGAEPRLAH